MGHLLIFIAIIEAGLMITKRRLLSERINDPVIGPILWAAPIAYLAHLAMESKRLDRIRSS